VSGGRASLEPRLRPLFWRSFCVQAVWNYRGMQHLGLLWAQLPATRRAADPSGALRRGLEFYNGHPYLAGLLLGVGARLESEGRGEELSRFKRAAISPLGTVGDRLFWATLRPLSGAIACLALLAGGLLLGREALATWALPLALGGALLATLGYNWIHFARRREALIAGWTLGLDAHRRILSWIRDPRVAAWSRWLAYMAGFLTPLVLAAAGRAGEAAGWPRGLPLLLLVLSWQLPRRGWALPALLTGTLVLLATI
jgi:mannose/fructose/N-acetylgalactosamine-specific phosphotransferase system component IID